MPDFMPVLMSAEVTSSLAGVLFSLPITDSNPDSEPNSGASTPDESLAQTVVITAKSQVR